MKAMKYHTGRKHQDDQFAYRLFLVDDGGWVATAYRLNGCPAPVGKGPDPRAAMATWPTSIRDQFMESLRWPTYRVVEVGESIANLGMVEVGSA